MVWQRFEGLNNIFGIDEPAGAWVDRYHEGETLSGFSGKKHTEESKKKISDSMSKKPIEYKGVWYKSMAECARAHGVGYYTMKGRYTRLNRI